MSENETRNEVATVEQAQPSAMVPANIPAEFQSRLDRLFLDDRLDRYFMEKSSIMARSNMMPRIFRGDEYACYAIQQLSFVWQMNPVLLAPGLYKVSADAPLSLEGKIVKSVLDRWAPVKDHFIRDEYFGDWSKILGKFKVMQSQKKTDDYGRPSTYKVPDWKPEEEEGLGIRLTAELLSGQTVVYELRLTQCLTRNSTLWSEDPKLQLFYRAVARFARKYFPGILNGMYVKEEVIDVEPELVDVTPASNLPCIPLDRKTAATADLKEKLGVKNAEEEPAQPAQPVNPESVKASNLDRLAGILAEKNIPITLEDVLAFINEKSPTRTYTLEGLNAIKKGILVDAPEKVIQQTANWIADREYAAQEKGPSTDE